MSGAIRYGNWLDALKRGRSYVSEAAHTKVIGLFAADSGMLQDGKAPVEIRMRDRNFSLAGLRQWPHPVVIVVLKGDDALHFRKCVWLF